MAAFGSKTGVRIRIQCGELNSFFTHSERKQIHLKLYFTIIVSDLTHLNSPHLICDRTLVSESNAATSNIKEIHRLRVNDNEIISIGTILVVMFSVV